MLLSALVTSCTTVFVIPPSTLPGSMSFSLSPSPSMVDRPIGLLYGLLTLYSGMLPGVFDLVIDVDGRMWRNIFSKIFRKGGRLAIKIPTESSVALQIVRLTLSQVGSFFFFNALSSMVLKIEHTVALRTGQFAIATQ